MIIFIERTASGGEVYREKFEQKGYAVRTLTDNEVQLWLEYATEADLNSVEALCVGSCESSKAAVSVIRRKYSGPVVCLVEQKYLSDLIGLFNAGADDVVVRPVHYEEVLVRLATIRRRALAGKGERKQTPAEEICLHFDGRDPVVAGRSINLPRRQRRILEYLASLKGRRATKSQIFEAIYGIDDEWINECVIESHISKLRKTLKSELGYDPIDSKRFLGYRLQPLRQPATGDKAKARKSFAEAR